MAKNKPSGPMFAYCPECGHQQQTAPGHDVMCGNCGFRYRPKTAVRKPQRRTRQPRVPGKPNVLDGVTTTDSAAPAKN